jgi:hypothetical protein
MAPPDSPVALLSPTTPKPMPMDFASPLTASLSPLPENKTDPQKQALGWFGVIESVLGVALWIEGQSSGWHCLTAVGYLVVFDAMGMAINMFSKAEAGWRTLRRPYGASRLTSLLCFSQSLFLLFAAVYIAKESLETAVLGPGGHDHGGSHGHGDHTVGDERYVIFTIHTLTHSPFPLLLLALASIASLFSGAVLGNNRRLLEATGELFLPDSYLDLVEPGTFLANPYTLSIAGTTAALLLAGLIMPSSSLRGFDSGMSLALTLLTGALAWPPAVAFAQILLQTAPPAASGQMKALRSALREVADDRRVLGLGTFRCWAINAGKPVPADVPAAPDAEAPAPPVIVSKPRHAASPSVSAFLRTDNDSLGLFMQDKSQEAVAHVPLVVTLVVHVHPETTDADVLDLSRVAWARLNGAVNRGIADGEVSVQVRRGWEGVNE